MRRIVERFTRSNAVAVTRVDVAALLMVTIGFFAPFLRPTVLPIHDTFIFFEYFHYFYGSFYFGEDLPRWIPYGAYGYRSACAQLYFLSPANYLLGLVGYLCRIEDALVLFKVSVLLEYLTLVVGLYLLSTVLFKQRATRLCVCIGVVGSTIWYAQLQLNFRVYYLLPLVTYLCARFLRAHRTDGSPPPVLWGSRGALATRLTCCPSGSSPSASWLPSCGASGLRPS